LTANGTNLPSPEKGWTGRRGRLCGGDSDVDLLGNGQRVVDLNAEITNRAFDFPMSKKKLDGAKISCSPIDQGRLGPAQGMGAVESWIEADCGDPFRDQSGVLPGR